MLPDWPIPKMAIAGVIRRSVQARAAGMSIVGQLPCRLTFEGNAQSIHRADGSTQQSDFWRATGKVNVPVEAIKSGQLGEVIDALTPTSTELGGTMAKFVNETIEAGVKSVGNDINADGKPITAENDPGCPRQSPGRF